MGKPRNVVTEGYVWQINAHDYPNFEITVQPNGKVTCEVQINNAHPVGEGCIFEMPAHVAKGLAQALDKAADNAPKPKRIRKPKAADPQEAGGE